MTAAVIRLPTPANPNDASESVMRVLLSRARITRFEIFEQLCALRAALADDPLVISFMVLSADFDRLTMTISNAERWFRATGTYELESYDMAVSKQVLRDEERARASSSGQFLIAAGTGGFTTGLRRWPRGASVPVDAISPAALDRLVRLGTLRWSASPGREVAATIVPEPPKNYPNPSEEAIEDAVKVARTTSWDIVQQWQAALAAVEGLLHESARWRARDLLLGTRGGSALYANAVRSDSERVARANGLVGRRPARSL